MAAGDVTQLFGAATAFTMTSMTSLATSATWIAGAESTAVITANPAVDYLVACKITTGTTPVVNTVINVYIYAAQDGDAPTYPDVFDGTDSTESIATTYVRDAVVRYAASVVVDATSNITYWIAPFSVAALYGGVLPKRWGMFVAHNTGVNLHATGSNHILTYTPVYFNVAQS
jgi:hypothetical protein